MKSLEDKIKEGAICPACKIGKLRFHQGKYTNFFGCSYYPNCTFVFRTKAKESVGDQVANEWVERQGSVIDPVI